MMLDGELNQLLELSNEAIYAWSPQSGVRRWNRGAARLYGIDAGVAKARDPNRLTQAIYPEPFAAILEQLRAGQDWSGEVQRRAKDGRQILTETKLQAIERPARDLLILEIDRDVSAEKIAHERQIFLTRELNHRVKNLFAILRGLVNLSGQDERDPVAFAKKLSGRIDALAAAHILSLDADEITCFGLSDLIDVVLRPYLGTGSVVSVQGENIELSGQNSTPLGLIFHELATNAAKHGAATAPGGKLDLTWVIRSRDQDAVRLMVFWDETFAPDMPRPEANPEPGFGTQLIDTSAAQLGGTCVRVFSETGLQVRLDLKLLLPRNSDQDTDRC